MPVGLLSKYPFLSAYVVELEPLFFRICYVYLNTDRKVVVKKTAKVFFHLSPFFALPAYYFQL